MTIPHEGRQAMRDESRIVLPGGWIIEPDGTAYPWWDISAPDGHFAGQMVEADACAFAAAMNATPVATPSAVPGELIELSRKATQGEWHDSHELNRSRVSAKTLLGHVYSETCGDWVEQTSNARFIVAAVNHVRQQIALAAAPACPAPAEMQGGASAGMEEIERLPGGYRTEFEGQHAHRWHLFHPRGDFIAEFDNGTDARAFVAAMADETRRADYAEERRQHWQCEAERLAVRVRELGGNPESAEYVALPVATQSAVPAELVELSRKATQGEWHPASERSASIISKPDGRYTCVATADGFPFTNTPQAEFEANRDLIPAAVNHVRQQIAHPTQPEPAEQVARKTCEVPEGWKCVPVEATQDMLKAANAVDLKHNVYSYGQNASAEEHWDAMLAAVPDTPAPTPRPADRDVMASVREAVARLEKLIGSYADIVGVTGSAQFRAVAAALKSTPSLPAQGEADASADWTDPADAYDAGFASGLAAGKKTVPAFGGVMPNEVVLPCDVWLPPATRIAKGCTLNTFMTALDRHARSTGWTYEMTEAALKRMQEAQGEGTSAEADAMDVLRDILDWARQAKPAGYGGLPQHLRDDVEAAIRTARPVSRPGGEVDGFQARVDEWVTACFGDAIRGDKVERNHRFIEEALELVQAAGCTQSEAHQLVDYVFGRPAGEIDQEVGGVMNTLAALCNIQGVDMVQAGDTELARCWTKIEKIRAKQAAKPKHSPLPETATQPPVPAKPAGRDEGWQPIETAPKDGTIIIAAYNYHPSRPAYWDGECWITLGCITEGGEEPYWWQSIPERSPPSDQPGHPATEAHQTTTSNTGET